MKRKEIINKRICRNNNCNKCDKYEYEVPELCEYGILHSLDETGLEWKERRSGKTSRIVKMANSYAFSGKDTMIIFKNQSMASWARGSFLIDERVRLVSVCKMRRMGLMGLNRRHVNIFMDEVSPADYFKIEEELIDCNIVKGFFT